MFNLIHVDGTDLICYNNGDIWRWNLKFKKWTKFVCKSKGYWQISITQNKKEKLYKVHRLICVAFKEGFTLDSLLVVDHINRDIHDNRVENLRCVTHQQNDFNKQNAKGYRKKSYIKKDGTILNFQRIIPVNKDYKP